MANHNDTTSTASRQEVFDAIISEREYQKKRWGERQPDGTLQERRSSVCDYLVYMKHYFEKAFATATTHLGNDRALDEVRKIASLAVACMEDNGCKSRNLEMMIYNMRDGKVA